MKIFFIFLLSLLLILPNISSAAELFSLKAVKSSDFNYNLAMRAGDQRVEILRFNLEVSGNEDAVLTWLGLRQSGMENRLTNIDAYLGNIKLGRTIVAGDIKGQVIDFYNLNQKFSKNTSVTVRIFGDILPSATQSSATIAFAGADFKGSTTGIVKSILHTTNIIASGAQISAGDAKIYSSDVKIYNNEKLNSDLSCDSKKYTTAPIVIPNSVLYNKLKGKIILKVQENGEAFYVDPSKNYLQYLCRPAHAFAIIKNYSGLNQYGIKNPVDVFRVMQALGVGISDANFNKLF